MKIAYNPPKNIRKKTREFIDNANKILEDFYGQGYTMSLRQLYYQLVKSNVLVNNGKNYKNISGTMSSARMTGLTDWDYIVDRTRIPQIPPHWNNIHDLVNSAMSQYRKDRHYNQQNYVEVWVEKDALSGILSSVTEKYHLILMSNKGYISTSANRIAALRFNDELQKGKKCHILYLGDHDPSGLNMIDSLRKKFKDLRLPEDKLTINPIALTMSQIKHHTPAPNPAKESDPRSKKYIDQFGQVSWELDSLSPKVLSVLLDTEIKNLVNMTLYNEVIKQEEEEKRQLEEFVEETWG